MIDQILTITKTAKLIGVSRPTVYKLIYSGQLKTRLLGERQIVLYSDLADFVKNLPPAPGGKHEQLSSNSE